jgi:MoxR-like ATPase
MNQYKIDYNKDKFEKKLEEFKKVKSRLETLAERAGIDIDLGSDTIQNQISSVSEIFCNSDEQTEIHANTNPDEHIREIHSEYVEVGDEFKLFASHFEISEPLLLIGPKGCGKSLAIAKWASMNNIPTITYDCSEGTKEGHLIGRLIVRGQSTPFHLGLLPTILEMAKQSSIGVVLILEELNALTPQMQKLLNPILDWRKSIYVEGIGKHYELPQGKNLLIVGTMNPSSYTGVNELNSDLLSRFTRSYWEYPSSNDEKRILKATIDDSEIPDTVVRQFLKLAQETRIAEKRVEDNISHSISTRELDSIFRLYKVYGKYWDNPISKLIEKVRGMYDDEDEWKVVRSRIESIFGMSAFNSDFKKLSEEEIEDESS